MSDVLFSQMLNEVDTFSFDQCIELLSKITDKLKKHENIEKPFKRELGALPRHAGMGKDEHFYMSPDFDEPLDCFKEYM